MFQLIVFKTENAIGTANAFQLSHHDGSRLGENGLAKKEILKKVARSIDEIKVAISIVAIRRIKPEIRFRSQRSNGGFG